MAETVKLPIYDRKGSEVGVYEVDPDAIATRISKQLLHDAVVMYQSNLRQGSAKSKTRSEVAGHKKKMYRQKGTGNARAGHRRSGVRRGGGHIFAKSPRDWSYRLPRKSLQVATRMAMLSKLNDKQILLVEDLAMDAPKTKVMASVLEALKIKGSLLIAIEKYDVNTYKSIRNIEGVRVLPIGEINAYELLRSKTFLATKAAMEKFVSG